MTGEKERTAVGQRLRDAREYCGFSQEEVATAIGVSRSSVSLMESGVRGVDALELGKLARLYQRSVDELLGTPTTPGPTSDIQMVARAAQGLSPDDVNEVLRFAEFLKSRRRGSSGGQKK